MRARIQSRVCAKGMGFGGVTDDLLGPQVAPTMSLQVIGPPSTGSKAVLWAESRLPRQTWSISESGHICSQMFEGRILDVKGKGAGMWEKAPEGSCGHWGQKKHLPISPFFCQVAGATTGTTRCCGSWPRTGRPRSGPSMCSDRLPFPSPGGFPWDEIFFVDFVVVVVVVT